MDEQKREQIRRERIRELKRAQRKRRQKRIVAFFNIILVTAIFITAVGAIYSNRGLNIDSPPNSGNMEENKERDGIEINADKGGAVRKANVYNILVYGREKSAFNTDTIMVVNVDAVQKKINILQIPRDTIYISPGGKERKINSSYANGQTEGLIAAVEDLLGLKIDKYAGLTTTGFREIVDAVGGVRLNVKQDMEYLDPYQDLVIDIKAGEQTLDGATSEGFVRFRSGYPDADLGRIRAQKQWIAAFIKTLIKPANLAKITDLAKIAFDNISTDLTGEEVIYLALQARSIGMDDATFYTVPGEGYRANFAAYREETIALINQHFNVYTEDIPESGFNIIEFKRELERSATDYTGISASEYDNIE